MHSPALTCAAVVAAFASAAYICAPPLPRCAGKHAATQPTFVPVPKLYDGTANRELVKSSHVGAGHLPGPESVLFDALDEESLYALTEDARLMRVEAGGSWVGEVAYVKRTLLLRVDTSTH